MSELRESNFNIDNGLKFWQSRLTTYKLTTLLAQGLLSASASQACAERILFVWTSEPTPVGAEI
jgi:hypothetical protein